MAARLTGSSAAITVLLHGRQSIVLGGAKQARASGALIATLAPPLNVDGATEGELRDRVRAAKAAYQTSASPRP